MKRALPSLLLLVFASNTQAHRLDEYLQATRITVATNRIDLSIHLTPGVAVFDQLFPVIDRDHDGRVSDKEAATYARRLLKDLQVRLDGKPLNLAAGDINFPPLSDARAGIGVIRFKAAATIDGLAPGRHELVLENRHLPAISVYLVNVLAPKNDAIQIDRQIRNKNQSNYSLLFTLKSSK